MAIIHYRPRFPAAVVTVPPATKTAVTTKPTTTLPPATIKTSTTRAVAPTTKAVATKTAVVPPTTKATVPGTSSVVPSTTLPLTTSSKSSIAIISSTSSSPQSTVSTPQPMTTGSKATKVASTSASSSASVSPSSSTSVTAVTAGVIGGLAGVVLTGLLVAFFLRRWNRDRRPRSRDSMNFDAKTFRRSAIMLDSSPSVPEFSTPSVRSMPVHTRQLPLPQQYQHPYMHQPASPYSPFSPDTSAPVVYAYPTPANSFYVSPPAQGYPPELHRQSSAGAAPHYQYENTHDAYGGI